MASTVSTVPSERRAIRAKPELKTGSMGLRALSVISVLSAKRGTRVTLGKLGRVETLGNPTLPPTRMARKATAAPTAHQDFQAHPDQRAGLVSTDPRA
jgi:hypothetical protein